MNYFKKYIDFLLVCSVIYLLVDKIFTIEKIKNTDITKKIQEVYKIDVDAIRNLSKLANNLTLNGKLVVPGGLEIQGEVTMNKGLKITGTLEGQGSNCLDLVGGLNVKFGTVAINRSDNYQALSVNAKEGAYISGKLAVAGSIHGPDFTKINTDIGTNATFLKALSNNARGLVKVVDNMGKELGDLIDLKPIILGNDSKIKNIYSVLNRR